MDDPSTIRRAAWDIDGAPYERDSPGRQRTQAKKSANAPGNLVHYMFHVRNMFFAQKLNIDKAAIDKAATPRADGRAPS
jgi:hypothetical protein